MYTCERLMCIFIYDSRERLYLSVPHQRYKFLLIAVRNKRRDAGANVSKINGVEAAFVLLRVARPSKHSEQFNVRAKSACT